MQATILWRGIEYNSLEHCQVSGDSEGVNIDSVIVGSYNGQLYRIGYTISLDSTWQVKLCAIKAIIGDKTTSTVIEQKTDGWWLNGTHRPDFENCTDIDIPLTPLTNSLPINRLRLQPGQEQETDVVYIDLLQGTTSHLKQKYRRIAAGTYKYENIPNDFEAEITVDKSGFVVEYPRLFVRDGYLNG